MKGLGQLLIVVGFLAGSLVATQTSENFVDWRLLAPALLLGVIGVAVARVGIHREAREESSLQGNMQTLDASLDRLVVEIERLNEEKTDLHPFEVHSLIDARFPNDLNSFVQARESIGHVHGLQAYADVMNAFAAAERYLNRVWSASVDCYIEDVHEYLERSRDQFVLAREKLRALGRASAV